MEQTVPEAAGFGLSSEVLATLAGAGIGALAAILAAVLTAIVQDWLAKRGKVRVVVPSMARVPPWHDSIVPAEPTRIRFTFTILFFNEKRLDIGIGELALTWAKAGEEELVYSFLIEKGAPVFAGESKVGRVGTAPILRFLDLPARKWVEKEIELEAGVEERDDLDWSRADDETTTISWVYPTGRKERISIPTFGYDKPSIQSRIRSRWLQLRRRAGNQT